MYWIEDTYTPEQIFKAANLVALPGGRENGDVRQWLAAQDVKIDGFAGRSLHR